MNVLAMYLVPSAALALAGCASMGGPGKDPAAAAEKETKAEARLCRDMTEKASAIRAFPTVDTETPLTTVQKAKDAAQDAVKDVKDAVDDVNNPNLLSVQAAFEKLESSVNEVPGGRATVGDASTDIGSNAQELQVAWDRLYRELQCGA